MTVSFTSLKGRHMSVKAKSVSPVSFLGDKLYSAVGKTPSHSELAEVSWTDRCSNV